MSDPESRDRAGRFKPGMSGNPGGRPKGLRTRVREQVGDADLVAFSAAVFYRDTKSLKEWGVDPADVTLRDQMAARDYLSDQGYGKAPSFAPVEDGDPLELTEADRVIDQVMDELAAAREAKTSGKAPNGAVAPTSTAGAART